MRPALGVLWLIAPNATVATSLSQPLWPATSTAPLPTTLMLPRAPVFSAMKRVPLVMEQATRAVRRAMLSIIR